MKTCSFTIKDNRDQGPDIIGNVRFERQAHNVIIYQNDHLGTPQKMTAVSGAVVWSAKYSSFGQADVDPSSTVINNLRYPGQYFDGETNFHYNYFRYYDSSSGRYLRKDPIGLSGGINIYTYVLSNPIRMYDNLGLHNNQGCGRTRFRNGQIVEGEYMHDGIYCYKSGNWQHCWNDDECGPDGRPDPLPTPMEDNDYFEKYKQEIKERDLKICIGDCEKEYERNKKIIETTITGSGCGNAAHPGMCEGFHQAYLLIQLNAYEKDYKNCVEDCKCIIK